MPRDYDKPKKTWREIDQNKDRSAHRQNDAPTGSPFRQARAQAASRSYKAKLDAFFDGAAPPPAAIKDKLEALSDNDRGKARKTAIDRISAARTTADRDAAVDAFMAQWSLPADYELLAELLRCGDTSHVTAALQALTEMVEANRVPKNKPVLEQRLRNIISLDEDPETVAPAKELLVSLRKFK
ncbi:MAG: hypothetical protein M0R76_12115 [Proteobacteria bacterium]|nr:hypothetical protein [Pseudomonadota bacterium]